MKQDLQSSHGVWFVAATHPNREGLAMEHLERQSFNAYCPMITRRIRHARRAYDAKRPLFRGYIFVRQNGVDLSWRPALSTFGIRSIVMTGDKPAVLPAGFVESLQAREIDGCVAMPAMPFQIGQLVTIQGGPFDGLIGQIIDMREKDRVVVLLGLLRQQTRVSVAARHLT
jgi:transcriptional antiterminator RfaH